jgi:hemerythrin-like metal-binding protein
MPFMSWNDRLMLGIGAVDDDHRKLVEILNALYDGVEAGLGKGALGRLLDELMSYTQYHFAREEALFARYDYPNALEHSFEHAMMAEWCAETQADFARGALTAPSLQVMSYLKDWLFDHIMNSDQRFGEWAREKGHC